MDTLTFFKTILPAEGFKVLAEFEGGKLKRHHFFDTHEAAAKAALSLDAAGKTVYHACATFKTAENRKQDNAGWMKSFWIDADVDPENPEKYPSQKAAVLDIARACKELELPLPLIVKSGAGIHGYWVLSDVVDSFRWRLAAERLKGSLDRIAFRQDRTRTADAASVLRPVGTTWRKLSPPRSVEACSNGVPLSAEELVSRIERGAARVGAANASDVPAIGGVEYDDLGSAAARTYAPSSAHRIVLSCPTLSHVAASRGDVEEPLWRAMLGLVKHTIEGESLAHDWSKGYAGYSAKETQDKLDRWTQGPTTCKAFRGTNGNRCAGCTLQVSSPIHLGYSEDAPAAAEPTALPGTPEAGPGGSGHAFTPSWPRGYQWDGTMSHFFKDPTGGGLDRWVPFCDTLWFPVQRVRGEDGVWNLRIKHQGKNHRWSEFELPCELIGSQQGLTAALAAHEIFVYGKAGVQATKDLLRHYTLGLQQQSIEQTTYTKLGWADEFKSFVIGNRRIGADSEVQVLAGEQVKKAGWDKDFGTAGSLEEWVRLVDVLYNREGAEPYQFTIGCAFAAPLIEITEASNWHGIPVALTGTTGLGKTTTCKVATSIYGHCSNFMVASGRDGATMNAMVSRIGTARNLPLIFDELTDRDSDEVSSFLYMLSSGRPKDRNRADGTIIDLGLSWNTISFLTSNKNVTELLFLLDEQAVTEATQIRVFEIELKQEDIGIWKDTNAVELIEHQLIEANYGHAGRKWLRYVMENRGQLKDEIRKLRTKYTPNSAEDTRERYYRDLIAAVIVALKHAAKIGLVKFDLVGVAKWAKANTMGLRVRRHSQSLSPDEYIASFLHSLHGRTIITKQFRDGRSTLETPLELVRGEPAARMAIDDKVFLVLRKAMADWCQERRLQVSWLVEEMGKRGMLVYGDNASATKKERVAKGTSIPSTPAVCYELVYDTVIGMQKETQ